MKFNGESREQKLVTACLITILRMHTGCSYSQKIAEIYLDNLVKLGNYYWGWVIQILLVQKCIILVHWLLWIQGLSILAHLYHIFCCLQ